MRTATATAGRWARILLLVGTLFGLAAMHTLGHGTHGVGHSAATTRADPAIAVPHPAIAVPHPAIAVPHPAIAVPHPADAATRTADAVTHAADAVTRAAGAVTHADAGPRGRVPTERHTAIPYAAVAAPPGSPARHTVAGGGGCPGDCPREQLLPYGGAGGGLPWWGVCLAVLGALAVPLLLAVLLAGVRAGGPAGRAPGGPDRSPRAPPTRPVGLRLATVSVLRR
ncbi:hypothetical protein GA0070606_2651 [Micromonospora citrea]|uniref:Uncharacterized protein n=1 Tax=Micromonospora citrea TaxID=47855 RepID=A0A1C6URL9_9ACTN|nr:hypothetical protein [Micromonospora citrea]SCL56697.1 hypothetical protein GA0070606_2651 [Micromonospora citrea]